jgi:hypothetical protein
MDSSSNCGVESAARRQRHWHVTTPGSGQSAPSPSLQRARAKRLPFYLIRICACSEIVCQGGPRAASPPLLLPSPSATMSRAVGFGFLTTLPLSFFESARPLGSAPLKDHHQDDPPKADAANARWVNAFLAKNRCKCICPKNLHCPCSSPPPTRAPPVARLKSTMPSTLCMPGMRQSDARLAPIAQGLS